MNYSFDSIIGNERIKEILRKSVLAKRFSHAYIFEGLEGAGKSLLANSFAKLIFCETKEGKCGCHSCVQFDAGSHSDLIYVNRGDKKSIGVELIRTAVINELNKKPFEYEYKVFIIDDAELMSDEAQNALLRSIEEPPRYAVFILLSTNINSFLPTVLSRCFIYKIRPFELSVVSEHLRLLGFSDERAETACVYSGGVIGKALKLRESDAFFELRERLNNLLSRTDCDLEGLFTDIRVLEDYKTEAELMLNIGLMWYRDVLAYKSTENEETILQKDAVAKIIACANQFSFKRLYMGVRSLMELKRSLIANAQFNAAIDTFAIKLTYPGDSI